MQIKIKGAAAIEAKALNNAALKHIAALEEQSGIKLQYLEKKGQDSQAFAAAATIFLSEHSRGKFIKWDEAESYSLNDIEYIYTPKEAEEIKRLLAGQEAAPDPTQALTDSGQGDEPAAAPVAPEA